MRRLLFSGDVLSGNQKKALRAQTIEDADRGGRGGNRKDVRREVKTAPCFCRSRTSKNSGKTGSRLGPRRERGKRAERGVELQKEGRKREFRLHGEASVGVETGKRSAGETGVIRPTMQEADVLVYRRDTGSGANGGGGEKRKSGQRAHHSELGWERGTPLWGSEGSVPEGFVA